MIRINSPFGKFVSVTATFSLVFCLTPSMAWAKTIRDTQSWVKSKLPPVTPDPTPSKILTAKTMKTAQGRYGENPYAAGQSKWDVMYKGVNMMTGNFTTSGTDLTFEGGYGIPVNVTRSYSSNDGEEGPLGKGWTLSVDVRSTAGGIMKSSGGAVRSVPTNFKERPSAQVDPNMVYGNGASGNTSTTSPVSAVLATDSGGQEETIQRDADGILSTPPWDKNKLDSEYETKIIGGVNYQVMKKNYVNTPEGTVYVYEKQGDYGTAGVVPFDNPTASGEPSNVLKITSATDRQGNVTTYTYGTGTVSFTKSNGTTTEHPLTKVHMPNGHEITFSWTGNRMTSASDGVRTVYYGYTSGLLTSVTSAGGKTTTYGYGNAGQDDEYGPDGATGLITSITNPQGLTTYITHMMRFVPRYGWTPTVFRQLAPNGVKTDYFYHLDGSNSYPISNAIDYVGDDYTPPGQPTGFIHGLEITQQFSGTTMSVVGRQTNSPYVTYDGSTDLWQKDYDTPSQNLMTETYKVYDHKSQTNRFHNTFGIMYGGTPPMTNYSVTTNTYNFLGNPLTKATSEYSRGSSGFNLDRSTTTGYTYWGAEKYYQQKAIKDSSGRLSYTDYYDNTATGGKKGQTYRVYDQSQADIRINTGITIPGYASGDTSVYWRYQVEVNPTDVGKYSAQFDYDSKGRAIDVWKIQSTTTTPWTYVRTHTTYGADSSPTWGQATEVVEDYGGINRTTDTLEYDSQGRATKVQDASGKVFHTTYLDDDDRISSIEKIIGSTSTPVVTYTYGTTGLTNGQVLSVTDNLSGVSQAMTYCNSGAGIGMPASVTETNGTDSYSTSYTYNSYGDIDTKTYTSQSALSLSGTVKWQYHDYVDLGAEQSNRAPQTLTNLDASTGNATAEEFHYAYDSSGRPRQVTFAMTPQSGYSPSGGASYYDASHWAATRGRAFYVYDGGGRIAGVYNWWDTYNSGTTSYDSAPIRANECVYETTGLKRGLKTSNKYYNVSSGSWNLQRTESYGYDANLDYLTSANYGDGLSNATPSWTYDAAGNRASDSTNSGTWSYDNLNRMTASPNTTYTNDILGNRTGKSPSSGSSTTYGWDDLNRMTSLTVGSTATNYAYRSDGLRVSKSSSSGLTQYRYDGQMGIEDVELNSSSAITAITRNALGARGIDAISRTTSSGTTVAYPLYDAHGNNVGMLTKSGSSWSLGDERTYDAWGQVRSGATTGDQKGRYCANIGHKQDDESGLIYMRARYYDPSCSQFISEDTARHSTNWFSYCSNDPINKIDSTGEFDIAGGGTIFAAAWALISWACDKFGLKLPHWLEGIKILIDGAIVVTGLLELAYTFLVGAAFCSLGGMEAGALLGCVLSVLSVTLAVVASIYTAYQLDLWYIDNPEKENSE